MSSTLVRANCGSPCPPAMQMMVPPLCHQQPGTPSAPDFSRGGPSLRSRQRTGRRSTVLPLCRRSIVKFVRGNPVLGRGRGKITQGVRPKSVHLGAKFLDGPGRTSIDARTSALTRVQQAVSVRTRFDSPVGNFRDASAKRPGLVVKVVVDLDGDGRAFDPFALLVPAQHVEHLSG